MLRSMLRDVEAQFRARQAKPDMVVMTGDLANTGKPDEYALAADLLDELLRVAGAGREQLVLVPGNHDVDRDLISPLARATNQLLVAEENIDAVIGSDLDRDIVLSRFAAYERFVSEYFSVPLRPGSDRFFTVRHFTVHGARIGVLGLNSAWLSAGEDECGRLVVGRRQVSEALRAAVADDWRIAALHHPLTCLAAFDCQPVKASLVERCRFILHGHVHDPEILVIAKESRSEVTVLGAGAGYEAAGYPVTYNVVTVEVETGKTEVIVRRFSPGNQRWSGEVVLREPIVRPRRHAADGRAKALFEDVAAGRCIPFVGTGLSDVAANQKVPSFWELADMLREYVSPSGSTGRLSPTQVFEVVADQYGVQWVRDKVCSLVGGAEPGTVHKLFASMQWRYIITTNYDRLLEKASRHSSQDPIVCQTDELLGDTAEVDSPGRLDPIIIKVHGDCVLRESMIVPPLSLATPEYLRAHPALADFLREHLVEHSALFLGYSSTDPNLRFLRELLQTAGRSAGHASRSDYLVLVDPSDAELEQWDQERGLVVISLQAESRGLTKSQCMSQFLGEMAKAATEPHPRAMVPVSGVTLFTDPDNGNRLTRRFGSLDREVEWLGSSGAYYCAVVCPLYLREQWLTLVAQADTTQTMACVVLAYEDLPDQSPEVVHDLIRRLNARSGLFAMLIDFSDSTAVAVALYAAAQRNLVPTLAVSQETGAIPAGFHPLAPVYYDAADLGSETAALGARVEPHLRNLLFSKALAGLNEMLSLRQFDAVVLGAYRTLEACMRYLCYKVGSLRSVSMSSTQKTWEMLEFLHQHEDAFSLVLDERTLGWSTRLRNGVAHDDAHASEGDAKRILRFVDQFIRYNVGPNLRTFDAGVQRSAKGV